MNRLRKVLAACLVLICLISFCDETVHAEYQDTGLTFTVKEGGFLGIGAKSYTYKILEDDVSWYMMLHYLDVCLPIYHTKNKAPTSLTYSIAKSYASETAYEFSSSSGYGASAEMVSKTINMTHGISKTVALSIAASGAVGRVIPSNASTGYYKMTICHNFKRYRLDKYSGTTLGVSYYAGLPVGKPYVAVLYSTQSDAGYSKY